jgi:hypothetical protein
MSSGPKGSEQACTLPCGVCGRQAELVSLPGRSEKCCLDCSTDIATSILLTTEIHAATVWGQETGRLVAELAQLSKRLLERAQSA